MRRQTRKALVQLCMFGGVLFFIIYLNRPSSNKPFKWNTIRYKTTSSKTPEAHGICSGLDKSSKPALVVSRVDADGDARWLASLTGLYHLCVYTADGVVKDKNIIQLPVPANRGHESMGYLTFIIDNYHHIPAAGVVFVHGSRWAWHNDAPDYDNAALLAVLDIPRAVKNTGYHNLRCDWSLSTCPPETPAQGSLENSVQAAVAPYDTRAVSDAAFPAALAAIFGSDQDGGPRLGRTETLKSQCCAQFVVGRDSILQHSREEYVALRQWLLDSNAAPVDDRVAGRILSYVWHILFIKREESNDDSHGGIDLQRLNALACPRADECYCRLYGRCNLESCTSPGSCLGQYRLPSDLKLPDDWAATHS